MASAAPVETPEPWPVRRWIPCHLIDIDRSYQRRMVERKVKKLRETWDQRIAGCIRVNARPNGRYSCMDGQHRLLAAIANGAEFIACEVYTVPPQEEAWWFERWNTNNTNAGPDDVFKAKLSRGDPDTRRIADICADEGYALALGRPAVNGWEIRCTSVLETLYYDYQPFVNPGGGERDEKGRWTPGQAGALGAMPSGQGPERLRRTLQTVAATWKGAPGSNSDVILRAVDRLWQRHGEEINWVNFAHKLSKSDPKGIAVRSTQWGRLYHHSSHVLAAEELLRLYNLGKRSGRVGAGSEDQMGGE